MMFAKPSWIYLDFKLEVNRELVAVLALYLHVHTLWFHSLLLLLVVPEEACDLWLQYSLKMFFFFFITCVQWRGYGPTQNVA